MGYIKPQTRIQTENLLNEFKGNLFEYLFASHIARHFNIEKQFIQSLPPSFSQKLSDYELFIRKNEPSLIKQLFEWGHYTASEFINRKQLKDVVSIKLVGKITGGSHKDIFGEADVIIYIDDNHFIPVSLKICKAKAYVNTKSGGIKSFLHKYFSELSSVVEQKLLNEKVELHFEEMTRDLHDLAGVNYTGDYKAWVASGLSELPGELESDMRNVLKQYYFKIIKELYISIKDYFDRDPNKAGYCLKRLFGLTYDEIIQVTCYYSENSTEVLIVDNDLYDRNLKKLILRPLRDGLSSFEFECPDFLFQIRVKPMNKFTTAAMKVNCSIKHLSH